MGQWMMNIDKVLHEFDINWTDDNAYIKYTNFKGEWTISVTMPR